MSTPTATVALVKAAVQERLEASSDLNGVQVLRGKPEPAPDEYVSLWKAKATRDYSGLRGGAATVPLDENIDLTIIVDVALASGTDPEPSEIRAYEIFAAVDAALRADLTLGGVWRYDKSSSYEDEFYRDKDRRGCRVFQTLSGKARI